MGLRVQSNVGWFPKLCLLQFFVANACLTNFVFPTWACAADFDNNNNNNTSVMWSVD